MSVQEERIFFGRGRRSSGSERERPRVLQPISPQSPLPRYSWDEADFLPAQVGHDRT